MSRKVREVVSLPGVSDLPTEARWHFAQALVAEMEGHKEAAAGELAKAISAEEPAPEK